MLAGLLIRCTGRRSSQMAQSTRPDRGRDTWSENSGIAGSIPAPVHRLRLSFGPSLSPRSAGRVDGTRRGCEFSIDIFDGQAGSLSYDRRRHSDGACYLGAQPGSNPERALRNRLRFSWRVSRGVFFSNSAAFPNRSWIGCKHVKTGVGRVAELQSWTGWNGEEELRVWTEGLRD